MRRTPPIGLGLAGCGRFGTFALAAAADLPGSVPVAVTDIVPERAAAAAAAHGARALPDFDALLAEPGVEVIIIATPPVAHGPLTRAAAEAGKHVFCEKPLAIDLAEAIAAVEAAQRADRRIGIDYVMRWNPLYWLLRRLQGLQRANREALLGPLRRFALENLAGDEQLPPGHWFWDRDISGGIFVEHGVHFFDAAAWLIGSQPIAIQALEAARDAGPTDTAIASTVHPGGATATYAHAFTHADGAEYQSVLLDWGYAHGSLRGWIPVDLDLETWTDADGAAILGGLMADPATALAVPGLRPSGREGIALDVTELGAAEAGRWRGRAEQRVVTHRVRVRATLGGEAAKLLVYRECVRAGLGDLVDAVRDGREPRVGGTDACASLGAALAAQRAADTGRTLKPERL